MDNKRVVEDAGIGWKNLAKFQKPRPITNYYRNRWQDQPKHRTEIWCEKDTVAVLIRQVVQKWDAILRISMSGFGRAFLVKAANELADVEKPITILFVRDWDPKGENIEISARREMKKKTTGAGRNQGHFHRQTWMDAQALAKASDLEARGRD
jgi:hypothetical protein